MSARCPFCGSVKTEKTFNFNESTCLLCNCDFKVLDESRIRVFNSGSWSTFCENMSKEASNMFTRAEVVELTTRLFKEHASHIDEADILLTQVTQMAENLSYEVKAGVRDRHDFIQMVELAESVENAVKTLIEAGEFVPPSGFDIQDFSDEDNDPLSNSGYKSGMLDAKYDDINGIMEKALDWLLDEYPTLLSSQHGESVANEASSYSSLEEFIKALSDEMGLGLDEYTLPEVVNTIKGNPTLEWEEAIEELEGSMSGEDEDGLSAAQADAQVLGRGGDEWELEEDEETTDLPGEINDPISDEDMEASFGEPKVIRITYEEWSEEDIEIGDTDNKGWIDEEGVQMQGVEDAVEFLKDKGVQTASSSQFHPGIWYSSEEKDEDAMSSNMYGDRTIYSYHLNGFTPEEEEEIYNQMKESGLMESVLSQHFHTPNGEEYDSDDVPEMMGFELEEDHLEDPINDVEDELRDVDDATFGVETQDDIRDVRDELRDVKDAIDDLWDAYRDSEEDDMGDDEMDMDMDMGGEDDLDLGLGDDEEDVNFGDEEGEEDETDVEEPEGEGMAVGIGDEGEEEEEGNPFESRRRKGRKLSESTIGSPSKKNTDNLRNGYKTQKSNSVNVTHDDVEWDGEEEDDIPYTKDERTKGENQFGETKLSNAKGAVDSTPTIDDFTLEGKPSGTGLGIREGFNGFRVGDAIFISESRDEWVIQKLNGRKAKVKRGRTSTIVDLLDESVEHADRNLRHHREQELMKESYLAWERCEQQILDEGCIGGVCGLGDSGSTGSVGATMVSELSPVTIGGNNIIGGSKPSNIVDKSEIYKYIKDNDLHRTTRDLAFEELQYTFNNPIEEINQILDDAVLSNDEAQLESIDNMYHYNRVVERKYQESMRLNDAFRKIEESNESVRVKTLNESIKRNPAPVITRREEQNNDSEIENLGRTWLNQISEGLDDV